MPAVRDKLTKVFKAFTYRDFRLLWAGAFTSSVGTWMQSVAQSWLVLTISGNAAYLAWADASAGRAVPRLLALRRRARGPDGPAADPAPLAGRPALLGVPPRVPRLHEPRRGLDDPRPVPRRRARAVLRRAGVPGARPDARRQGRPSERGRAQLDPVQPRARHRPGPRGRGVLQARRGRVLRAERPLVLRGHPRAPRSQARGADRNGQRQRDGEPQGGPRGREQRPGAPRASSASRSSAASARSRSSRSCPSSPRTSSRATSRS